MEFPDIKIVNHAIYILCYNWGDDVYFGFIESDFTFRYDSNNGAFRLYMYPRKENLPTLYRIS